MQRCGKCKPCLNPHFKQACTEVKAAKEVDRSSHRSSHTTRRARLSAINIPLAKLDHEAAITPTEAHHEEQLSNRRFQRDSPSPSVVSDHEQHCLPETAQATKRAATEDSDNHGCNKRICFRISDPERTAARTAASPATADPESCFIQVEAFRENFQSETAKAQAAAQDIQGLHIAAAEARAERERLGEQQASAMKVASETKALSQQIQQDLQALHKAAAEAKAERQALLAQATASQAIKAEAQVAIERAQQTSDKLDVDVAAACQSLQSDKERMQTARREALDACTKVQASMTSSAQQHEQRLAETQAEVQEATEAAQHAQAAEAEATTAADKAAASSVAAESIRADATAASRRCQQVFDNSIKAIAGARQELSTRLQQTIKNQITAAVHHEVTAATQQPPANWKSLQSVATGARKLMEGVDQEIRNSVESAVCSAKAEVVSTATEAVVAATAMENLGASHQAGTSQGTWQRHEVPDVATAAKQEALHEISMAEQRVLSSIDAKAGHGLMIVCNATQKGLCLLQRLHCTTPSSCPSPHHGCNTQMTSNQNQVGSELQAGHIFA
ncbi:hypothetical protein WJX77_002855 [Trebouxia sp. C0004]